MALPVTERLSLEAILTHYCEKRVPPHVRDQVQLHFRIEGLTVTLFEKRPYFKDRSQWLDHDIARFRYVKVRDEWELFHRDRNGRWRKYSLVVPNQSIEPLLQEIDKDPNGIFWG